MDFYTQTELRKYLQGKEQIASFPKATDRKFWDELKNNVVLKPYVEKIFKRAEQGLNEKPKVIKATMYLDFHRKGSTPDYSRIKTERTNILSAMVVAECLENNGRFLDEILNYAWLIMEESSWCGPSHIYMAGPESLPKPGDHYIDLAAAIKALLLAEVDYLLGEKLNRVLRERIRYELEQRIFTPFEKRHFWWMGPDINNWAAVCVCGVVSSAIYMLKDPVRLAAIVEKGLGILKLYLDDFTEDGGTSEGVGYWQYGFSYFAICADLLHKFTSGEVDLLQGDKINKIVQFPLGMELSKGKFINFSDAAEKLTLHAPLLVYLGKRTGNEQILLRGVNQINELKPSNLPQIMRSLYWLSDIKVDDFNPKQKRSLKVWYPYLQWAVFRRNESDDCLALAVKGGHNEENHNHNDVGNFIVHYQGESLIADPGWGVYDRDYFQPETRYQHLACSSKGHSVPVINGYYQQEGSEYRAENFNVFHTNDKDIVTMDLFQAYPLNANVENITRKFEVIRGNESGTVLVEDSFRLKESGEFASVLVTFADVNIYEKTILLNGENSKLQLDINGMQDCEFVINIEEFNTDNLKEDMLGRTLKRIIIKYKQPIKNGFIRCLIKPR